MWMRSLFGFMIAIGLMLILLNTARLQYALDQREWPATSGRILKSEIVHPQEASPLVEFEYTVNGVRYTVTTDLHFPAFGGRTSRLDAAMQVIAQYAPGQQVTVHYNPQNPAEAVLKAGPTWDIFGQIGLGLTLLLPGAFFLGAGLVPVRYHFTHSGNNRGN